MRFLHVARLYMALLAFANNIIQKIGAKASNQTIPIFKFRCVSILLAFELGIIPAMIFLALSLWIVILAFVFKLVISGVSFNTLWGES